MYPNLRFNNLDYTSNGPRTDWRVTTPTPPPNPSSFNCSNFTVHFILLNLWCLFYAAKVMPLKLCTWLLPLNQLFRLGPGLLMSGTITVYHKSWNQIIQARSWLSFFIFEIYARPQFSREYKILFFFFLRLVASSGLYWSLYTFIQDCKAPA